MNIGLIGLPQAGKRTLFMLLTGRAVSEGRKAGESVAGSAPLRDPRVDVLADIYQPKSKVYAENRFVLCPDADVGGASHEWLGAVAKCDLLCIVLRAFESDMVYHPEGTVDPERDRKAIGEELLLADLETVEKRLDRIAQESRAGLSAEQKQEQAVLAKCRDGLEGGCAVADIDLEGHEAEALRHLTLVTRKPVVHVYNVSEDDLCADCGDKSIAVSCSIEQEIAELDSAEEQREYLEAMGLESPGMDRMNAMVYDVLGLMSFYTVGQDECRAWTIRKGSTAPVAGGKIHSDIQRGFIRVEVVKYEDLVAAGSEQAARQQGKLQTRGKEYVMEDGDICHFLFNV